MQNSHFSALKPWLAHAANSRLVRILSGSIFSDVTQALSAMLNSVLLVHFLGSTTSGIYYLLYASFGTIPALLVAFDQALTRFLPVSTPSVRHQLAVGTFLIKLYGSGAGMLILSAIWYAGLESAKLKNFMDGNSGVAVAAGAINFFVIPLLLLWAGRILTGYKDYAFQIGTDVVQAIATTAWTACAMFYPPFRRLDILLIGTAVVTLSMALVKASRCHKHDPLIWRSAARQFFAPRTSFSELFSRKHFQYFGPAILSAIAGFLKDQFPILIVGAVARASSVTEFRIIQQIFRFAAKLVPNAFEIIRPGLVSLKETDRNGAFMRRYQEYALGYLFAAFLFGLGYVQTLAWTLPIWSLHATPALYVIAALLSLDLLFQSAAHVEFQVFMLRDSTVYVAWMSLSRQFVASIGMLVAARFFGAPGVASGLLAGTVFTWLGFSTYAWRHHTRPRNFLLPAVTLVLLASGVLLGSSLFRFA